MTSTMDALSQWHRAMTTIVLFGTKEMPISSVTLADTFRIIDADEFLRRMLHTTRTCSWTRDIFSIKADAIFTLEGVPQCVPIPLATAPHHPHVPPHHIWFHAFLRELWTIWGQTPSVIVIRMILPIALSSRHEIEPTTPALTPPAVVLPSSPPSSLDEQYAFFENCQPAAPPGPAFW